TTHVNSWISNPEPVLRFGVFLFVEKLKVENDIAQNSCACLGARKNPCSCIAALASSQRAGLASYGQLLANSVSFHFARVDLSTSLGPLGVFAVLLHISD